MPRSQAAGETYLALRTANLNEPQPAMSGFKLNLGCGTTRIPGYIGVDVNRGGGADLIVGEIAGLLRAAAGVEHLGAERRVRAIEMASMWREHVLARERAEPARSPTRGCRSSTPSAATPSTSAPTRLSAATASTLAGSPAL